MSSDTRRGPQRQKGGKPDLTLDDDDSDSTFSPFQTPCVPKRITVKASRVIKPATISIQIDHQLHGPVQVGQRQNDQDLPPVISSSTTLDSILSVLAQNTVYPKHVLYDILRQSFVAQSQSQDPPNPRASIRFVSKRRPEESFKSASVSGQFSRASSASVETDQHVLPAQDGTEYVNVNLLMTKIMNQKVTKVVKITKGVVANACVMAVTCSIISLVIWFILYKSNANLH